MRIPAATVSGPRAAVWTLAFVCLWLGAGARAADDQRTYGLDYRARFVPAEGYVEASIEVSQSKPRLVELDFNAPQTTYQGFEGDGKIRRDDDRVVWQVPARGGAIRYRVEVDHKRGPRYDARMNEDWAVARLDDLFPPVSARSRVNTRAEARLFLEGPDGWSFETRYGPVAQNGVAVETAGRRFDRPLGWLAAGDLGIRRSRIADRRVAIAGPRDQDFRRMDMLAFLRWTMPELVRVVPSLPSRVLIVGGSQDMWRGGLSGPGSLYVHPGRPLVSGNSTSTLLHELIHVATDEPPAAGADWVVEGLAEYYSLVILLRTGGISGNRFQRSLEWLEEWAREDGGKLADPSSGADTARAVLLFRDLDLELRRAGTSLDPVTGELLSGEVSIERLAQLVEERLDGPSRVLARALDGAGAVVEGE